MPFSGPSSYLSTIDGFIAHWTDVDAALAPGALELSGPYALADLQADRTQLSDEITDLIEAINDLENLRTQRDTSKEDLHERMRQLGAYIRGALADSNYAGEVPPLVAMTSNTGKWILCMRDFRNIWTEINATPPAGFTPPLILTGGYTLAMFTAAVAALEATFTGIVAAEKAIDRELKERDAVYLSIRDQLVRYREAVQGSFPADHPLVLSLPRISPLPGHTPEAVVLSGVWNAGTQMADLSWTASADPDLEEYEIRRSGESPYNTNLEQVVDSVPPGTLAFSTNAGLTTPGAIMRYKVYVVLTTGNEKGSNAVEISNEG